LFYVGEFLKNQAQAISELFRFREK